MILSDTQRQLLDRVQRDRKLRETFQQMAQQNIKVAFDQLEALYGKK